MPTAQQIETALAEIIDQKTFINKLLVDALGWPIEGEIEGVEDISFGWSSAELRAEGLSEQLLGGSIRQLQPLEGNQPWGIFLLEFKNPDVFTTGRGLTGPLRKVLRGLVPKKQTGARPANLPAWKREHLLFICTHNYQYYRFAYFKAPKEKGRIAPLTTFGWEPDTPARTTYENLCYLEWPDDTTAENWVSKWTQTFDVEKVNKKFYTQIAQKFTDLVGGWRKIGSKRYERQGCLVLPVGEDDQKRKEFAVRLIGRLVFCWFLKKKHSEPDNISLVHKDILSLDAANGKDSYYHFMLEPLFFEVLNKKTKDRHKKYKTNGWNTIPFLNGGLFTPHIDDYYTPDDFQGISPRGDVKVPDEWIRELLGIFERYNFTIEENTPLDIELSIDPEMLGRIFENLLAEINPETGETARKSTGSYYTPRPIVEYMVNQSIKQYLLTNTKVPENKIDSLLDYSQGPEDASLTDNQADAVIDALDKAKVLDPACGSGAFPIGVLQKILLILQKVDPDSKKWKIRLLAKIPNSAARKTLAEKLKSETWQYIHKLGVIQNSIYGVDIQPIATEISKLRIFLSLIVDETVNDSKENRGIEPLPNLEFKFVCANTLIGLPEQKENGQSLMFEAIDDIAELKEVIDDYFTSYGDEKEMLEQRFRDIQSKLRRYMLDWGKTDTQTAKLADWEPFGHDSCPWFDPKWMFCIEDGFDIIIGNPPYIDSETMVNLGLDDFRNYLVAHLKFTKGNWDIYIAFFEVGFNLLNKSGIITYITPDKWISKPFGYELRKNLLQNYLIITESGRDVFESANVDSIITFIAKTKSSKLSINKFMKGKTVTLANVPKKSIVEPFTFDWLFSNHMNFLNSIEKFDSKVSEIGLCDSACATSDAYKLKEFIVNISEDSFSPERHLKIINTGTIDKYISKWGKTEMTYLRDRYLFPVAKKSDFLNSFANTYGAKSIKQKLIIKGLTLLDVCYDVNGEIIPGKSTLIVTDSNEQNLKFLLGLLNSKLPMFYIKEKYRGSSYNQGINFNKGMINNFPIPKIDSKQKKLLIKIVEKILAIKERNSSADTTELEHQIDWMVYNLYGLTEEEIAIVENKQ